MQIDEATRVKLVRVIARLNVGGPAQHVIHLSLALEQKYPTVLVTGPVSEGEGDMLPAAKAAGVRLRFVPSLARELSPVRDMATVLELTRLFRELRPLIVHTHTAKAGTAGRVAAVLAGVPIRVHTFHGHVFDGYFGRAKTNAFLAIERALARVTTRIIAISASQKSDLVERYRIAEDSRFSVIPLGLELARFSDVRSSSLRQAFRAELDADDRHVIAIVGRMVPIKNHTLFLEAAAELLRTRNDCVFVVVGDGPERESAEALASALGIASCVKFLGWRADLERIYAGSDVVVLTSRNEGTPVCLIEAMSAGCPVVSTNVGGVGDVLEGGALGELVAEETSAAVAAGIDRVLSAGDGLHERTGRAQHSVMKRFALDRLVRDLTQLYDELIEESGIGMVNGAGQ